MFYSKKEKNVLDNCRVGRGLRYDREGRVQRSDIPHPFKAFKMHHHVVLNPVCHRTNKENDMAIDCNGIDTGS